MQMRTTVRPTWYLLRNLAQLDWDSEWERPRILGETPQLAQNWEENLPQAPSTPTPGHSSWGDNSKKRALSTNVFNTGFIYNRKTGKAIEADNRRLTKPSLSPRSPQGPSVATKLMCDSLCHSWIYFYEKTHRGLDIKYHSVESSLLGRLKLLENFTTSHISDYKVRLFLSFQLPLKLTTESFRVLLVILMFFLQHLLVRDFKALSVVPPNQKCAPAPGRPLPPASVPRPRCLGFMVGGAWCSHEETSQDLQLPEAVFSAPF